MLNNKSKHTTKKVTLLMFLSMVFGFVFAWLSGIFMAYRLFTMRRDV